MVKCCSTCLYALTHEGCEGCLSPSEPSIDGYPYRNYKAGDGSTRLLEQQRRGERNIVIGGEGEHEINALWTIHEAYAHLAKTCEACGGIARRNGSMILELCKTYGGVFEIEYMHGALYQISKMNKVPIWEAHDR